jgi:uncharacterized protein (DUF1499 family)
MRLLGQAVSGLSRVRIVTQRDDYLHAEFTTPLLRFVDDVEFLADPAAGVIHVRSASRVGYSDLGVNRRRVRRIREAFEKVVARRSRGSTGNQ